MNKIKVKCPCCDSDQLYKFSLDKQANQKYQCKNCKCQFAPDSVSAQKKSKYPKCPKYGKDTFLHHAYKHDNRYKYGNKKCNHVVIYHHDLNIDNESSENLTGSLFNERNAVSVTYYSCSIDIIFIKQYINKGYCTVPTYNSKYKSVACNHS